jgi:hypothetical protein
MKLGVCGTCIREQLHEHIQPTGLTPIFTTFYQSFGPTKCTSSDSMEDCLEKLASGIQQLMSDELSSRMVEHEQQENSNS